MHLDRGDDAAATRDPLEILGDDPHIAHKRKTVAKFYLYLGAALMVIRRRINKTRSRYRWAPWPTTRRRGPPGR